MMIFKYKVAYLEKDGSAYHGLPYIFPENFYEIEEAKKVKKKLNDFGMKRVTIFQIPIFSEITWEYVEENKVDEQQTD